MTVSTKFWKSSQFDQLKREWEEKLAQSGFRDAERDIGGERVLRQTADYAFRRRETVAVIRECKLTYFTILAQHLAEERNFADEWDRLIMERTAEGKTIKEISEELRAMIPQGRARTKHSRDTIRYVRRRYEHKWGIKVWRKEEMQSRKVRTR